MPNVLSPRDLVSRPDNMDEIVLSSLMGKHSNLNHRRPDGFLYSITSDHRVRVWGAAGGHHFDCQ